MKPPSSYSVLIALVLIPLGGLFALLGLLGQAFPFTMRSGEAWQFIPVGLILAAVGGLCILAAAQKKVIQSRLLAGGRPVQGSILEVKHHIFVTYNISSFTNCPGKNSPWTVLCQYTWEGRTYTVRSGFFWRKPSEYDQHPVVYLDPEHPKRAFLDPDSIRLTF